MIPLGLFLLFGGDFWAGVFNLFGGKKKDTPPPPPGAPPPEPTPEPKPERILALPPPSRKRGTRGRLPRRRRDHIAASRWSKPRGRPPLRQMSERESYIRWWEETLDRREYWAERGPELRESERYRHRSWEERLSSLEEARRKRQDRRARRIQGQKRQARERARQQAKQAAEQAANKAREKVERETVDSQTFWESLFSGKEFKGNPRKIRKEVMKKATMGEAFALARSSVYDTLAYPFDWMFDKASLGLLALGKGALKVGKGLGLALLSKMGGKMGEWAGAKLGYELSSGGRFVAYGATVGANFVAGTAGAVWESAKTVGRFLSGGEIFPYKDLAHLDPLYRYAPSSHITRRIAGAMMLTGAVAGISEVLNASAPEPSVYFDGINMRHMSDLGADATYARSVLRKNRR